MIPNFRVLNPYFDTGSLYSFEDKVLRVLLQLESPKSDHRNSRYILNNRDYSVFKQNQKLSEHSSPLNAFLSPNGSEFGLTYFKDKCSPISLVYLGIRITQFG